MQAVVGMELPGVLRHLNEVPEQPAGLELPLLFVDPPAQLPYGPPRRLPQRDCVPSGRRSPKPPPGSPKKGRHSPKRGWRSPERAWASPEKAQQPPKKKKKKKKKKKPAVQPT